MNLWLWAACGFILCLIVCGGACLRGDAVRRLVGLEVSGTIAALALLCLAQGFHRTPFYDVALMGALLSFGAGVVFSRFLERWL